VNDVFLLGELPYLLQLRFYTLRLVAATLRNKHEVVFAEKFRDFRQRVVVLCFRTIILQCDPVVDMALEVGREGGREGGWGAAVVCFWFLTSFLPISLPPSLPQILTLLTSINKTLPKLILTLPLSLSPSFPPSLPLFLRPSPSSRASTRTCPRKPFTIVFGPSLSQCRTIAC